MSKKNNIQIRIEKRIDELEKQMQAKAERAGATYIICKQLDDIFQII